MLLRFIRKKLDKINFTKSKKKLDFNNKYMKLSKYAKYIKMNYKMLDNNAKIGNKFAIS
jgi:hypothetical protein